MIAVINMSNMVQTFYLVNKGLEIKETNYFFCIKANIIRDEYYVKKMQEKEAN